MRGLLGLADTDLEGKAQELEAYAAVREYLLLLAVKSTLAKLKEKLPPGEALEALETLLGEALESQERDLAKYGPTISEAAAIITMEAETIARLALSQPGSREAGETTSQAT